MLRKRMTTIWSSVESARMEESCCAVMPVLHPITSTVWIPHCLRFPMESGCVLAALWVSASTILPLLPEVIGLIPLDHHLSIEIHSPLKTISSYTFVIQLKGLILYSCIVPWLTDFSRQWEEPGLQPLGLMRFVHVQGSWAVFGPGCQGSPFLAPVCV